MTLGGKVLFSGGQDLLVVEMDFVRRRAAGLESLDVDERVVALRDLEGARAAFVDGDFCRLVALDPDRGLRLAHVAEDGTQKEPRHRLSLGRVLCVL